MAAMRWQEKENEEALEESLERFLRDIAARYGNVLCEVPSSLRQKGAAPAVSVRDTGPTFLLRAELPGVGPAKIKVTTGPRTVTIEGVWSDPEESVEDFYLLRETREGGFRRVIELPETIAGDLAVAVLENGILEIELPKNDGVTTENFNVKLS